MFFRKKKKEVKVWDRNAKKPVIRMSICTGEKTAGFERLSDHRFEEVMLVRDDDDLKEFKEMYGIEEDPEIIY